MSSNLPPPPHSSWICCQLGGRQYYAIPRGLHARGVLRCMITDLWLPPGHPLRLASPKRLRERYHTSLRSADVKAWNWTGVLSEYIRRRRLSAYGLTIARNNWFTTKALNVLKSLRLAPGEQPILFSYSYTAAPLFEFARRNGWRTVLMQIDCGELKSRLAASMAATSGDDPGPAWRQPPPHYWQRWKCELEHADLVVANSSWTRENLELQGVPPGKIFVQPLAYEPPAGCHEHVRHYPASFSPERPMRVLFLGQLRQIKGISALLNAAMQLRAEPIEFLLVGKEMMRIPDQFRFLPNIQWIGSVPRCGISDWYRHADVFIFPTLTDGFGITQLEAQAWKLPIIASRYCGQVVEDRHNGLLLPEVSASTITDALRHCVQNPGLLGHFSSNSVAMDQFGVDRMATRLIQLVTSV